MSKQVSTINLEILYQQYKNQIYTLCIRLVYSRDLADDLFGETWVKAAEKFHQLDSKKNPANWLYTICLNTYRKSRIKQKHTANQLEYNIEVANIEDKDLDAEEKLMQQETSLQLQKALIKLNDKYRLPIILFYFKDLSYNDIATIMKIPLSTVKFRLNHGKMLLKKEMEVQFGNK